MGFAYPNLNLSQITIDDTVPPTPGGDDTISDETIGSAYTIKQEVKVANGVVLAQPASKGPNALAVSSTIDLTTADRSSAVNPNAPDAPPS